MRAWGAFVVAGLAFIAYALCATPAPYFLDSAELAAATFGLGVAHPPGEVTALLWGKLFDLLPLGNVAFRAALSQAVAGALAALLVYALTLAVADWLDPAENLDPITRVLVAAATAMMFAFAPGVVIVCNRAEVYALQTALSLAALWLALRAARGRDARLALVAAVLIGLGIANHSLLAGLVGLGAVTAALPLLAETRRRFIGLALLAFLAGMTIHAYLPLRAAALFGAPDHAVHNVVWGDARSWRGLWWVVSAHTFAVKQAVVQGQATPGDLPFLPMEELGEVFALLAPAGLYFLLRHSRWPGLALLVAGLGSVVAALIGGLTPSNPDIRGYLGPAFALIAVFSGAAILFGLTGLRLARLRPMLAALLLVSALSRFPRPNQYPGLRHFTAGDAAAGQVLAHLPPRAALMTNHFETAFLVGYQRLVEARRPDVAWAHLAFVGGPGYAERVGLAEPDLAPSLQAYRRGEFSVEVLRALDARRPVRIEPDIALPQTLRRQLVPAGDLWAPSPGADSGVTPLAPWMLAEAKSDPQARGYLGWRAYIDAVWACDKQSSDRVHLRFAELESLLPLDVRFKELKARCTQ